MTDPQKRIESDVKDAMKAGDKERLSTLRMLLAELKNERIRRGSEVDEEAFVAVLRRGVKQRAESAEQYRTGGRTESAEKEEREAAILETYLPQQADEAEIRAYVETLAAAEGLSGPAAMGKVMGATLKHFGTRADGATVSRIARDVLTS